MKAAELIFRIARAISTPKIEKAALIRETTDIQRIIKRRQLHLKTTKRETYSYTAGLFFSL